MGTGTHTDARDLLRGKPWDEEVRRITDNHKRLASEQVEAWDATYDKAM